MSKKIVKKEATFEELTKELFFDDKSNLNVNRLIVVIALVVGAFVLMANKGVNNEKR